MMDKQAGLTKKQLIALLKDFPDNHKIVVSVDEPGNQSHVVSSVYAEGEHIVLYADRLLEEDEQPHGPPPLFFDLFKLLTDSGLGNKFNRYVDGMMEASFNFGTLNGLMGDCTIHPTMGEQGIWDGGWRVDTENCLLINEGRTECNGRGQEVFAKIDVNGNVVATNHPAHTPKTPLSFNGLHIEPLTQQDSDRFRKEFWDALFIESGV